MSTLATLSKSKFLAAALLAGVMLAACSPKPEAASDVAAQQLIEATQKAEEAAARAEAAQKALEQAEAEKRAAEEKAADDAVQADAAAKVKAAEAKAAASQREATAARRRAATAERQVAANNAYTEARPAPAPVVAPKPICQDCGTITSITAVKIKGKGTGMGAVAGAIAGIAAGNQVGDGKGTDVAKVVGAIGGAYAGNQAEKYIRADTVYDVIVRLDNGGSSTVRVADAATVSVGSRVRVNGANLERL